MLYQPDPVAPVTESGSPVSAPIRIIPDINAHPTLLFAGSVRAELIERDGRTPRLVLGAYPHPHSWS